jgi:hypothetical protein
MQPPPGALYFVGKARFVVLCVLSESVDNPFIAANFRVNCIFDIRYGFMWAWNCSALAVAEITHRLLSKPRRYVCASRHMPQYGASILKVRVQADTNTLNRRDIWCLHALGFEGSHHVCYLNLKCLYLGQYKAFCPRVCRLLWS